MFVLKAGGTSGASEFQPFAITIDVPGAPAIPHSDQEQAQAPGKAPPTSGTEHARFLPNLTQTACIAPISPLPFHFFGGGER
jgi:hypothetical protein